jgi:hypothetical protein
MIDNDKEQWTKFFRVRFGSGKAPVILKADNLADAMTKAKKYVDDEVQAALNTKGYHPNAPEIKGIQQCLEGMLIKE